MSENLLFNVNKGDKENRKGKYIGVLFLFG